MPTRNVNLTEELDRYVEARVEGGRYANASEVVRASLRALEREEREFEQKLALLKKMIAEGDASSDVEPGVFERLQAYVDTLGGMKGEHVA